jgi:hypothetical protein
VTPLETYDAVKHLRLSTVEQLMLVWLRGRGDRLTFVSGQQARTAQALAKKGLVTVRDYGIADRSRGEGRWQVKLTEGGRYAPTTPGFELVVAEGEYPPQRHRHTRHTRAAQRLSSTNGKT